MPSEIPAVAGVTPTNVVVPGSEPEPEPFDRRALRRLRWWIAPANIGFFIMWGAVIPVIMPLKIAAIDPANKAGNLALISTITAVVAMAAQPIAGRISDRTRSRFGRRAPWLIAGALVGGVSLIGLGFAGSFLQILFALIAMQIAYNFVQGPLSTIMPDRIPRAIRGTFSALTGMGLLVGSLLGSVVGASLASNLPLGTTILAGVVLVAMALFVVFNPDHSSKDLAPDSFRWTTFLRTFWVNPIAHPDFFWAFTGRLLLYIGYLGVTSYQLYILQDYIGLGAAAVAAIPLLGLISLVGTLISTLVSGPLSDKINRRKLFVFISSALVGVGMIVPIVMPSLTGWSIFTFVAALGFGAFQAVDTAIMSEVLPSSKDFGKDLGVVNLAVTVPQTIAPALGGLIVVLFHGYVLLFPIGIVLSLLGAFAIIPIKKVR